MVRLNPPPAIENALFGNGCNFRAEELKAISTLSQTAHLLTMCLTFSPMPSHQ